MTSLYILSLTRPTYPQEEEQYGAMYVCCTDSGEVLAEHYCFNDSWAAEDLGIRPGRAEHRRKLYKQKFPQGFEIQFLPFGDPRAVEIRSKILG